MAAARESKEGNAEGEAASPKSTSRTKRRKRTGAAVSIRKGKLLFLPTAFPEAFEKPVRAPSDGTKARDSEEN